VSGSTRKYRNSHIGKPDASQLMPPDLRTFPEVPFGDQQRARLSAWLQEAGWPRGHMEFAELEGFLVALLAWPVGLPAGAWLPLIWGTRGWKLPNKISARPEFEAFVALIVGFLRALDRELSDQKSKFKSSVLRAPQEQAERVHAWGRGFMTALTLGSQGFKGRTESASAAVHTIANTTAASATFAPHVVDEVVRAVLTLVEQRVSRGPLGALEAGANPAQ
jgi:yecA family protein